MEAATDVDAVGVLGTQAGAGELSPDSPHDEEKQKVFESIVCVKIDRNDGGEGTNRDDFSLCTLTLLWSKATRYPSIQLSSSLRKHKSGIVDILSPDTVASMDVQPSPAGIPGGEILRFVDADSRATLAISLPSIDMVTGRGGPPSAVTTPQHWGKITRRILLDFFRYWDDACASRSPETSSQRRPTLHMQADRGTGPWTPRGSSTSASGSAPTGSARGPPSFAAAAAGRILTARPFVSTGSGQSSSYGTPASSSQVSAPNALPRWRSNRSINSVAQAQGQAQAAGQGAVHQAPGAASVGGGAGGRGPFVPPLPLRDGATPLSPVQEKSSASVPEQVLQSSPGSVPLPLGLGQAHAMTDQGSALAVYALMQQQQQMAYMSGAGMAMSARQPMAPLPAFAPGYPLGQVYSLPAQPHAHAHASTYPAAVQTAAAGQAQYVMMPVYAPNGSGMPVMYMSVPQGGGPSA